MGKIYYIIVAFAALLFTACQEEDFGSETKGGIRISLAEEVGMDISTRSTPKELGKPLASNFKFRITDSEGHKEDHNYTDDVIPLSAGKYEVVAYCGSSATTIALDAPYYEGTAEATVEEGKTTNITLACKVANALLSIRINEDDKEKFNAAFPESYFKLSLESGDNKVSSDTTKSFYFPAGSTITKLAFSKDDSDYQDLGIKNWPPSIKAADHIIVTVGIEPAPSGVSLAVEKIDVQEVPISETIPLEWLPKPKVEADGFTNNALTFVETETPNAKLNLDLASALQDIKFKFDFENEQFSNLNRDTGYLYSNAEDKAIIETTLGISVSDDNINLNNLLAQIQTNAGETTTNTIEVDVKANNRWSSEDEAANRTYTITCNKPVFKVDAYPGNIWTKEFTMNALREEQVESGDFSKISQNIKYQYSTDKDKWTDLGDDLRQANLNPGTTYYIRGLYRDAVPGEVAEVMTYPETPLTNGNLNTYTSAGSDINYGTRYYWDNWATLNDLTCDNAIGTQCWYNTRSGTQPIVGPDNTTAAWIATIGWGYGSSNWATIFGDKGTIKYITPGELFLGSLTDIDHGDDVATKNYGIEYDSRPTAVSFKYKYEPYDGDHTDIYVQVLHDNIILGEKSFQQSSTISSWTETTNELEIDYSQYQNNVELTPNKLILVFKSGVKESVERNKQINDVLRVGSQLYIDDISLVYDK